MIKCPYCGKSHYMEGLSMSTAMYFPPIYENGINVNPDRNIHTTECECLECGKKFLIVNGEVKECQQPEIKENPKLTEESSSYINADLDTLAYNYKGEVFLKETPALKIDIGKCGDITFITNDGEITLDQTKLIAFLKTLQK